MTTMEWIVEGKTGISSKAIWSHFTVGTHRDKQETYPRDPSDFLRCYWLLKLAPEWRTRIAEMARYSGWDGIATNWSKLELMLLEAWPKSCSTGDYCNEPPATEMYYRMKVLIGEKR